ncbi:hypothetical protein ACWGJP_05400 [Microbacterium sp. NPDC055903]
MLSIDSATAFSSAQDYSWFGARRSISEALERLDEAGIALVALSADAGWQAEGMRALQGAIEDISARVGAQAHPLRQRLWELELAHG